MLDSIDGTQKEARGDPECHSPSIAAEIETVQNAMMDTHRHATAGPSVIIII